jgi:hypothetical protein
MLLGIPATDMIHLIVKSKSQLNIFAQPVIIGGCPDGFRRPTGERNAGIVIATRLPDPQSPTTLLNSPKYGS